MEKRSTTWSGRLTSPELGPLYFYQIVKELTDPGDVESGSIVLNGYPFDEGVRLNQGRVGASKGPDAIRSQLAKCALQNTLPKLCDLGDIHSGDFNVIMTQSLLAERTCAITKSGSIAINLGGGHDMSYGSSLGLFNAFPGKAIGTINFDAHLDLRNSNLQANSGSPFYQSSQLADTFSYLAIGIQKEANTMDLFETAAELDSVLIYDEEVTASTLERVATRINEFMDDKDVIHLSLDMDVFPFAIAPGVSAANPIGVEPKFVLFLIEKILLSGKVKVVDIAEVNPDTDIDQITAKLAARIIAKITNLLS